MNHTISLVPSISQTQTQSGFLLPISNPHLPPIEIDGVLTLGRSLDNDIVLENSHISSQHAQFEKRPAGFFVKDLKSRNGVFLNWARVIEAELTDGSLVVLGTQEFRFSLRDPSKSCESQNTDRLQSKNKRFQKNLLALPHMARSDLPIFLEGETGVGKEVMARLIHELSDRKHGPFVSVNCSALSESLVESELFGHLKGSFTGATCDRKGAFQEARGGTLFLDEIGDLSASLQPKLLRALENQEIRPIGGDRTITTNVRIVTATHKSLQKLVSQKEFRQDLFFRVHILSVSIPPLRQRVEDLEDLTYTFGKEFKVRFSAAAIDKLKEHSWPGNIRELKNFVAKIGVIYPQTYLLPEHIQGLLENHAENFYNFKPLNPYISISPTENLTVIKEMEKTMIYERLLANNWNQRKTAQDLRMPKSTLHDRIRLYSIKRPGEPRST